MTAIRTAVLVNSFLKTLIEDGLHALEPAHLSLIEGEVRVCFEDSLNLDEALKRGHEQENRWDYLLGHRESQKVIGLEPHTANNHEISEVIKKRAAAIEELRLHLRPGVHVTDWFWVASGKVDFLPIEKAYNRLASNGIKFVGKRLLKKHLPAAGMIKAEQKSKKKSKR